MSVHAAARPLWRPGMKDVPPYLTGSLPGDYGRARGWVGVGRCAVRAGGVGWWPRCWPPGQPPFLGHGPGHQPKGGRGGTGRPRHALRPALAWYQQAELQNGRWAMLGAAGILGENLLGNLGIAGPAAKTPWYEAGAYTYFAPPQTLFIVQLFLFAWVEARRYQDFVKPGSVNDDPIFKGNSLPAGEQWDWRWRVWRDVLFPVWRPGRRATHPTRLQPPTRQRPRLPGRHL